MLEQTNTRNFGVGVDHEPKAVFDKEQFESTTMYDGALQAEILVLFDQQLASVAQKLANTVLSAHDNKFISHTLRGAAAAVGAIEIELIASSWEAHAAEQANLATVFAGAVERFRAATVRYGRHLQAMS